MLKHHGFMRLISLLVVTSMLVVAGGMLPIQTAEAATFSPGCNVAQLLADVATANGNGVTDTIELAAGCTYNLTATLDIATLTTLIINGNGAVLDGGGARRVVYVRNTTNLTLNNVTVTNGSAADGAGVYVATGGILTVNNSLFSNNVATTNGGAIYNFSAGGTVTIVNSTFTGNRANRGGVVNNPSGALNLINVTLNGNSAATASGAIHNFGTVNIDNSIIVDNISVANCNASGTYNTATSISDDGTCGATSVVLADVALGGLTGSPAYFPLLATSVAIDAGSNGTCPANDQAGQSRPVDGDKNGTATCDIGAYEYVPGVSPDTGSATNKPATAEDHARAQAPLCADLDGSTNSIVHASVPPGALTSGSVFCRVLAENGTYVKNPSEVGNQTVVDQGIYQAVDVFALRFDGSPNPRFNMGVTVCLQGTGVFWFMDATQAPRIPYAMASYQVGGDTCATIPNAGTVALTGGAPSSAASVSASSAVGGSPVSLSGCMVTTHNLLNLRSAPDAASGVVMMVPYDVTLTAFAEQGGWYQVDYLGTVGWLHSDFVGPNAACGA